MAKVTPHAAKIKFMLATMISLSLIAAGCPPTEQVRPPIVKGLADYHSHQFAHLGFGQSLHTHGVDPSEPCRSPLAFDGNSFKVQDMVRGGILAEATAQAKVGKCYPSSSNLAGQQVATDGLYRAYQYGLRLMVMLALNSEFLCRQMLGRSGDCKDVPAIDRQLDAAYAMEARIDSEAGGPGQGWYQIVTNAADARRVIDEGKLAVVLGIEASGAFDCGLQYAGQVQGVTPPIGVPIPFIEDRYVSGGCPDLAIRALNQHRALARFDYYWSRGVRHFFPIHTFDNELGGTALSTPLLHAENNPSGLEQGNTIFNRTPAVDATIRKIRPPFTARQCPSYEFDDHRCNSLGLSETGKVLISHAASRGSILDIDHMSRLAKLQTINLLGEQYSLVSSHTGVLELNHSHKSNEVQIQNSEIASLALWDGAFAPILRPANTTAQMDGFPPGAAPRHTCGGTSESFIGTYRYMTDQLRTVRNQRSELFAPEPEKFVGVGFGSDFNGLAGWPIPRFWGRSVTAISGPAIKLGIVGPSKDQPHPCIGGRDDGVTRVEAQVDYDSIRSPLTGVEFGKSTTPWGNRAEQYDISYDGFAHIGMLPDFMSELQVLGLSDEDVKPLWNGAEAYIRMWENASGWGSSGTYGTEASRGLIEQCSQERSRLLIGDELNTDQALAEWQRAIDKIVELGCHGS